MPERLNTYIRRARKRSGLSQRELAALIGKTSGSYISRFEKGRRVPPLDIALALSVALQTPVYELFAGRFQKVEQAVTTRAEKLCGEHPTRAALRRVLTALQANPSSQ